VFVEAAIRADPMAEGDVEVEVRYQGGLQEKPWVEQINEEDSFFPRMADSS
jgi:hypothetical protein